MPAARKAVQVPTYDPDTAALVRKKAGQVARRLGLPRGDAPDVEQDIAAHVWPRLAGHDPARLDRAAFVRMLVARAAATAMRCRRRWVRRPPASLDVVLRGASAAEPIDPGGCPAASGQVDLALDLTGLLAALPYRLRRVANALKVDTVAAAARRLKLSRAEVYRRMGELREHLADLRP